MNDREVFLAALTGASQRNQPAPTAVNYARSCVLEFRKQRHAEAEAAREHMASNMPGEPPPKVLTEMSEDTTKKK